MDNNTNNETKGEIINYECKSYNFIKDSITSSVSYIGSLDEKDGKTRTTLTIQEVFYIEANPKGEEKDVKVVFKNINFNFCDDIIFFEQNVGDKQGIINIGNVKKEKEGHVTVEFDNCTFYGFTNEYLNVITCGNNATLILKNTKFSSITYGASLYGDAKCEVKNCLFDAITGIFFRVADDASFYFDSCNARVDEGIFLQNQGKTCGGLIENSAFNAPYYPPVSEDIIKAEQENPFGYMQSINYNCIDSNSKGKLELNNCVIHGFCLGVFTTNEEKVEIKDCEFSHCYYAMWLNNKTKVVITNSKEEKCFKSGLFLTDECTADISDSRFTKNTYEGICLSHIAKLTLSKCKTSNNNEAGVRATGDNSLHINECSIQGNGMFGLIVGNGTKATVSKTTFGDNKIFQSASSETSEVEIDGCTFLSTGKEKEGQKVLCHILGTDSSKYNVSNSMFSSSNKEYVGIKANENAEFLFSECKFRNLEKLAKLEQSSKIYIKDSDLRDINDPIAEKNDESVLDLENCSGSFDK